MRLQNIVLVLVLINQLVFSVGKVEYQTNTYSETRKMLLKMERHPNNRQFRKLFAEADIRMADLIQALDDPQENVSVNAQVILKYFAAPKGLNAIDEWSRKRKEQGKDIWLSSVELLSNPKYLEGNDSDLVKLVMKNRHLFKGSTFNTGDISPKVIAYNKRAKVALIEIVQGQMFTAGWHAVIKQEGDRWLLISDNIIWVT
jgi:hypothetical protein